MQFFTYVLNTEIKILPKNKFDIGQWRKKSVWKKKFACEKKVRKKICPTTTVFETATFGLLLGNSKPNALPLRHVANWLNVGYSAINGWTFIYAQKPTNTNTAASFHTVTVAAGAATGAGAEAGEIAGSNNNSIYSAQSIRASGYFSPLIFISIPPCVQHGSL